MKVVLCCLTLSFNGVHMNKNINVTYVRDYDSVRVDKDEANITTVPFSLLRVSKYVCVCVCVCVTVCVCDRVHACV
jgi:hypothetical protein